MLPSLNTFQMNLYDNSTLGVQEAMTFCNLGHQRFETDFNKIIKEKLYQVVKGGGGGGGAQNTF